MAPKSLPILFAILSVLAVAVPIIAASTAAAPRSPRAGGYKPIANPNAPAVVAVARFAVAEHNKEKKSLLVFKKVVKGEWQVVEGINYRLVIAVNGDDSPMPILHTAVVHKDLKGALSLVSFQ